MGLRINDFIGFGLVAILLFYYVLQNKKGFNEDFNRKFIWLAIYVVFASVLGTFFDSGATAFTYLKQFFRFFTGVVVFISFPLLFRSKKDLKLLLIALLISTFTNTFFALGQILIGPGFMGLGYYVVGEGVSLTGTYDHYGQYAMVAVMGPLIVIALLDMVKKNQRVILLLFFLTYIAVGMGTLSRSVLICLIIELIAFSLLLSSKKNFQYVFLFGLILFVFVNTDYFSNQVSGLEIRSEYEFDVLQGEKDIVYLGHGRMGRFIYYGARFWKIDLAKQLFGSGINIGPHGDWFYWLFMYGALGLTFYLVVYIGLLRKITNIYKSVKSITYMRGMGIASIAGMVIFIVIGALVTNSSMIIDYQIVIMGLSSMFIYHNKLLRYKRYKRSR